MSTGSAFGFIAAKSYAAAVYLSGLILYFFAGIMLQTHAPGAAGVPLLAGACYAALAPLIWNGHRWAMIVVLAAAAAAVAIVTSQSPRDWWLGLPFVGIFTLFTVVSIVAGTKPVAPLARGGPPGTKAIAKVIAEVHAAAVYLYSFVIVFLWPDSIRSIRADPWGYVDPRHSPYVLLLGLLVGALCIPIWRTRLWAMVAAFALVTIHWLSLATLNESFWANPWYAGAPVVSGMLTVLYLIAGSRAKPA